MIITAVIGVITLMVTMFIGIRWVLDKTPNEKVPEEVKTEMPIIPFNSTICGVIKEVDGSNLIVFDIEKKQSVRVKIESSTTVKDAYDKPMSASNLKVGDVVQLVYEPKNQNLLEISHYIQAWIKSDMKNIKLDKPNRLITIGDSNYKYTDHTVILDKEGKPISIYQVGDQDILELKGIDDNVHSIRVLEEQGYLEFTHIPLNEGMVEIDINRQIPIGSITAPIPVTAGEHKVVIQMPGHETITQMVEVIPGETTTLDLSQVEKSYASVVVQLQNEVSDYSVQVGDTVYKKGEEIRVLVGEYTIQIKAEGYEPWSQSISLTEPLMNLQVNLQPVEIIEEEPTESNEEVPSGHKVSIATEPGDAEVYINGSLKGKTPFEMNLEVGDYILTIQKEGYESYETGITIEANDEQNSYLYMLIPKINE